MDLAPSVPSPAALGAPHTQGQAASDSSHAAGLGGPSETEAASSGGIRLAVARPRCASDAAETVFLALVELLEMSCRLSTAEAECLRSCPSVFAAGLWSRTLGPPPILRGDTVGGGGGGSPASALQGRRSLTTALKTPTTTVSFPCCLTAGPSDSLSCGQDKLGWAHVRAVRGRGTGACVHAHRRTARGSAQEALGKRNVTFVRARSDTVLLTNL